MRSCVVRFVAHHFVSDRIQRIGSTGGAPYYFAIYREGQRLRPEELAHDNLVANVARHFRGVEGLAGQAVTASSATNVLQALADRMERVVHAPGPLGLVGGYPVRITPTGISIDLPEGLSLDHAEEINTECQKYDGIQAVESDGTVRFTGESAEVMRELLAYDCEAIALDECEDRAKELVAKCVEYSRCFDQL